MQRSPARAPPKPVRRSPSLPDRRSGAVSRRAAALSYIAAICSNRAVKRRSGWRAFALALEYWLLAALLAGAFLAGIWGGLRTLID